MRNELQAELPCRRYSVPALSIERQTENNEEMEILTESIRQQGILSPLIVRPMENKPDEYEVISGHRRLYASVKAGLTQVPALIYPLDRNAAIIAVVDIQPFCRPMTYPFMRLW